LGELVFLFFSREIVRSSRQWTFPAGAVALAKALTENSTLRKLSLSDNYIGALGATTIAAALARNSGITDLQLKGSEFGDAGAQRLCEALVVCPTPSKSFSHVLMQ
jgi:Ran GTPase-activating protein (RanGAP) involved in mRNA processing and transport